MNKKCFAFETYHEGENKILKISADNCNFPPSIEYSDLCMGKVIDVLMQVTGVTTIIVSQLREYEYDFSQTKLLIELAQFYKKLNKDERYSYQHIVADPHHERYIRGAYAQFQRLIQTRLKEDPLAAFVGLKRFHRKEKIKEDHILDQRQLVAQRAFLAIVEHIIKQVETLSIISQLMPHTKDYQIGQREIYGTILNPTTKPDFMYTKLVTAYPEGNLLESYEFGEEKSQVNVFSFDDNVKKLYHLTPPEFRFSEEVYSLLDDAKRILAEHKPSREEFVDPQRMREVFFSIGKDLISDLMQHRQLKLKEKDVEELAQALLRYTVGFGLIELLLNDPKVQDVNINAPNGELPIFIVHQDHGDCYTNVYPTHLEVESWATKLRLISGRPLDEANPILDTELKVRGFGSRVSALTAPLSPTGLAFSFRRHRDHPWTFPLYMQPKIRYMDALGAGLLSFLIDNNATMLVAGTRSSGKSSLLGSFLIEIMRQSRILTIEDSVAGDTEIFLKINNIIKRVTIGDYIDSLDGKTTAPSGHQKIIKRNVQILSLSGNKVKWKKVSTFIKHKVNKFMYEIETRTGRKIKVTQDHSLFTLKDNEVTSIQSSNLKEKDFLAVTRSFVFKKRDLKMTPVPDTGYVINKNFIGVVKKHRKKISDKYHKSTVQSWINKGVFPLEVIKRLKLNLSGCHFKISKNSLALPLDIHLDEDILKFIGLWIADGCYDKNSVIMSVSSKEEQDLVKRIATRFGFETKKHSDKFSLMINSKTLKYVMKVMLKLTGNAYTKRVPEWVFNMSEKQVGWFLSGLFSGDGHAGKNEIVISLCSRGLIEDIQTLLLGFGIILRIGKQHKKDKTFAGRISPVLLCKIFQEKVGFLQNYKNDKLDLLCKRTSTHDSSDVIPINDTVKEELKKIKLYYYKNSGNHIGRKKLQSILKKYKTWPSNLQLRRKLEKLASSDIFWDQVKHIKKSKRNINVYDLSVPGSENFLANNIIAHNTFELPQESLRALGYNIEPLKVAGALSAPGSEVDPSIGIRSTLRMGDSAIFVGEVRSKEAIALFEAMRVGAAANVVAGTIHADSPYGVYDRVVNDIGVPKTSFKAIDIIVVTNPVISGLKKYKRILRITEVRKEWDEDPLKEGAFVDLMVYDASTDKLEITEDLRNGNSDILKRMAGRVKEFAGDWDAVWNNIQLRADIKQAIVDISLEHKDADLLEAEFIVSANDRFHIISEAVREKTGKLGNDEILFKFKEWLKSEVKKRKIQ